MGKHCILLVHHLFWHQTPQHRAYHPKSNVEEYFYIVMVSRTFISQRVIVIRSCGT